MWRGASKVNAVWEQTVSYSNRNINSEDPKDPKDWFLHAQFSFHCMPAGCYCELQWSCTKRDREDVWPLLNPTNKDWVDPAWTWVHLTSLMKTELHSVSINLISWLCWGKRANKDTGFWPDVSCLGSDPGQGWQTDDVQDVFPNDTNFFLSIWRPLAEHQKVPIVKLCFSCLIYFPV